MKEYRVLWFDDKFESLEMIRESAYEKGIVLEGVASSEDGVPILEKNIESYDAVLLDGLFYEKRNASEDAVSDKAIKTVFRKLDELKNKKILPAFILSGQESFTKEKNSVADIYSDNKVYDKTIKDDIESLWNDIIFAANQNSDTQLKHKYCDILEVCHENYLGADQFNRLFDLLKFLDGNDISVEAGDKLNALRKIIERIFSRLGEKELIPKEIVSDKGWMNNSGKFLSNKHSHYAHNVEFIPPLIGESIFRLLNILQDGSHVEGSLKLKVDNYLSNAGNNYFYQSCIYALFDLICWYKQFVDKNPDKESNSKKWRQLSSDEATWVSGVFIEIQTNGYGTFKKEDGSTTPIPPRMIKENGLVPKSTFDIKVNEKNHILEFRNIK